MPNSTGRARHLRLVPDIATEDDGPVGRVVGRPGLRRVELGSAAQLVLKVTLHDVATPVWRRFAVMSDLTLPELHDVLQAVMGWNDSHLHAFSATVDGVIRRYETQESVDEDPGLESEEHVRTGSLLAGIGDSLTYEYDFGASWTHTVEVEWVDNDVDDTRPAVFDGEGYCPPENCGGPRGYADFLSHFVTPPPFIPEIASSALGSSQMIPRSAESHGAGRSTFVKRLYRRSGGAPLDRLTELVPRCGLDARERVDAATADMALTKISWFLRKVDNGLPLTSDGKLPPEVVDEVGSELDWGIGWNGDSSREIDHHQATDLREATKRLGLVRVLKGSLVRTLAGKKGTDDPVRLWWHCTERLPLGREDYELDAGSLYLVALASECTATERDALVQETMHSLRWGVGADRFDAEKAAHPTIAFLDLIGAHGPLYYLGRGATETPHWARLFARDALMGSG